jgi:hypothetical protein
LRLPHRAHPARCVVLRRKRTCDAGHDSAARLQISYAATTIYALDLYTMRHSLQFAHDNAVIQRDAAIFCLLKTACYESDARIAARCRQA